jgi:hypothetical protein
VNRYLISGAIALIIAMPTPVLALTIQNDLADQQNAELRYEFPANFRQQIETIEARSGARFYVYAGPYSPDDESLKRSPNINAGANKAEQLGLSLIGTGDYDADRTTVIAWLRNQDNPAKGSVGVAPSLTHRRAGATSRQLADPDGLVIPILRRYMPQDPSGAIVAIANNLWTLQQIKQAGGTLLSWFGIGVSAIVIGLIGWYAIATGREIWDDRNKAVADLERRRSEAVAAANNALARLRKHHADQGEYYQRLLNEPDVIQGMEIYLDENTDACEDMAAYRAAATTYSSAYTRTGQFLINHATDLPDTTAIEEAESVKSTTATFQTQEEQAREKIDQMLINYTGKYGGFIAYRRESVAERQGHIPARAAEMIASPWTGEPIYRWGGIAGGDALDVPAHLARLAHADDWDSFRQFEKLIEIHRKNITDREALLNEIEAEALRVATILDLWANYTLPDRNQLVGEGTYYSQQDLLDYDAIAATIKSPPTLQELTQQAASLFASGEFRVTHRVLLELIYGQLDAAFTKPSQQLAEIMRRPSQRRRDVELATVMQQQSVRSAAAAPRTQSRSSSSSNRRTIQSTTTNETYETYYSSPPPPPVSSDWGSSDWGGGGNYDSGAGGGDY